MTRLDEKQIAVARVYSRSMLELAEASGDADSLLAEMRDVLALRDRNPDLRYLLESPLLDARERTGLLEKLLRGRVSDLFLNSLQVLNEHGRLGVFETLVELYRQGYEERHGKVDVHVRSAVPLDGAARAKLLAVARELAGSEPNLIETVDDRVIAGLVVRIGDHKFDNSVATQLRGLRQTLSERASQEIYSSRLVSAE